MNVDPRSPLEMDPDLLLSQRRWIKRVAVALVRDDAAAEDLAQETWITAIDKRAERRGQALRPWLRGIARNLAKQWRRGESRRARRQERASQPEALPSTGELVERAEMQRLLAEGVVALDEPYRTAVLLRYFEGLNAAEIARRLGVPAATVRSRIHRGLATLRTELDRRHDGDRAAWHASLVGLARGIPGSPPQGSLPLPNGLEGALAMKAIVPATVAAAALVTAAVGWWWAEEGDGTPVTERGGTTAQPEGAVTPAVRGAAENEASEPVVDAGRLEVETPAGLAPEANQAEPAAPPRGALVSARILDDLGNGLAGARLERTDGAGARSAPSGDIQLALDDVLEETNVFLEASFPGLATRRVETSVRPGETRFLGEITLAPAGSVAGWVEDHDGQRVAGARLYVAGLENERSDPELLRRQGPILNPHVPRAISAADGTFRIEGIETGSVRIWAAADGLAWASQPVTVAAGEELGEVVLTLGTLREDDRIEGLVLAPDGSPVSGVRVEYWFVASHVGTGGATLTDREGRFSFLVDHRVPHDLTVTDGSDRWSDVFAPGVEPGSRDVVLEFQEPRWMELVVTDSDDRPIESFSASAETLDPVAPDALDRLRPGLREGGIARFRVPTRGFRLEIESRGYEAVVEGPFQPDSAPETLAVSLRALPGVVGRVIDEAGNPVGGVEVGLRGTVPDGQLVTVNDFRARYLPRDDDSATTEDDGSFVLYPERRREYVLRAEYEGYAPTVLGPMLLDPTERTEDIELALVPGGAIEGRVVPRAGGDPAGMILGLNCGDGEPRTIRVGTDGTYRVERLTPGPWQVVVRDEEILPGRMLNSYRSHPNPPEIEWSCEVVDGETTYYDVDLRAIEPCTLRGQLQLENGSPAGWTAALGSGPMGTSFNDVASSANLNADGSFELVAEEPGLYFLALYGPGEGDGRLVVREELDLQRGERTWSMQFGTGRLVGDGATVTPGTESFLEYRWTADPGASGSGARRATVRIVPDREGRFVLPLVPAGVGEIMVYEPPRGNARWGTWETVLELRVNAGEETRVVLP